MRCGKTSLAEVWNAIGLGGLLEDGSTPEAVNALETADSDADPDVQRMAVESVADDLTPIVVIASGESLPPGPERHGRLRGILRRLARPARPRFPAVVLTAADAGFRDRPRSDRPVWLAPMDARAPQEQGGTPSGAPVRMVFTSLGTSMGEAFQAAIVNDGEKPVLIDGMRLVLEPLKASAARRARSAIQKFQAHKPTTVKMTGYCLEFLRPPPLAGSLFRVAPKSLQQRFEPMRRILDAGHRLRREGRLTPDSEPVGYYHAIRQWAIWTQEQGFTEAAFADAFVEDTKKTFAASGHGWSAVAETTLRKAAPGRWRDIQQVLAQAAGR